MKSGDPQTIASVENRVIEFAAAELRRYLVRMAGEELGQRVAASIRLSSVPAIDGLPPVRERELDDQIDIHFANGAGSIAGSNPRAVLIGVYRFLRELGCRWLRPGRHGEIVPQLDGGDLLTREVRVREAAASRHRGICIEGACSREHVLDLIDWMPKAALNSYFIQFRQPYAFYERWYRHIGNPELPEEPFDLEMVERLKAEAVAATKSRGLLYHAVGHGWTSEVLGIPSLSWKADDHDIPEESMELLAQIDGRRGFFHRIAMNTNLCYGNPKARRLMAEEIVRYAAGHPEVDYLHVWLADDVNNQCECPLCASTRPSDFYVMMLNEADRMLAERSLPTRIVMLCYLDLLWPPEHEKLANPGRFALMFAPITRTFSQPFPDGATSPVPPLPGFARNKLVMPHDVGQNLAFLQAWLEWCPALDTFDFDYHLMWAHFQDPGHRQITGVLHADTRRLGIHGMNGLMSCQVQRLFLPSSLPMAVLGRGLWNPDEPLDEIETSQLAAEFGPEWRVAGRMLLDLTERFDPVGLRGDAAVDPIAAAAKLDSVPAMIESHLETVRRNQQLCEPAQAASWRNLELHMRIWSCLSVALAARARRQTAEAHAAWRESLRIARHLEMDLAPVFDLFHFTVTLSHHHFDHVENPAPPATTLEVTNLAGEVVHV